MKKNNVEIKSKISQYVSNNVFNGIRTITNENRIANLKKAAKRVLSKRKAQGEKTNGKT